MDRHSPNSGERIIFQSAHLDLAEVREGWVGALVPKQALSKPARDRLNGSAVFYNPVMEFNRDISILALKCYAESTSRRLRAVDAMTGCGIRGIRYAVEVENVEHVLLNDIQKAASELARMNAERNQVSDCVDVTCMDANLVLNTHSGPDNRFDIVDLDPFGSPAPFLDSAVRAASNNALIALTATDMPALCGVRPKAALRRYGGRPLRTEYCHEVGARLLIASLASAAARHDLGIDVKLTQSTDHYLRVYATVRHGGIRANEALGRLGYIAHCFHCFNREPMSRPASPNCGICGRRYAIAGPLWLGSLYDKKFCSEMLDLVERKKLGKKNRVRHMLQIVRDEIEYPPTYYRVDRLSDRYQTGTPKSERVVAKLREMGYLASLTHFHGYGVRTDAGPKILEQMLRELSKEPFAE